MRISDPDIETQRRVESLEAQLRFALRLLEEVFPMVESYKRKHERAYAAAERKGNTRYMEFDQDVVNQCNEILSDIAALTEEKQEENDDET